MALRAELMDNQERLRHAENDKLQMETDIQVGGEVRGPPRGWHWRRWSETGKREGVWGQGLDLAQEAGVGVGVA